MRILYFDYTRDYLPVLLRSFELTRGAAKTGHTVQFCLCHRRMKQARWFFTMLTTAQTDDFTVAFPWSNKSFTVMATPARPGPAASQSVAQRSADGNESAAKISTVKTVLSIVSAFRFVPVELRQIRRFSPDVVVARPDHVFSFLISCRIAGIPLVLSTDGPVEELGALHGYKSRWPVSLDLARARRADAILHINSICGDLWKQKGIAAQRLFECPNGADPDIFTPLPPRARTTMRERLGFSETDIVLGFCGNQRFWHGLGLLLSAFARLHADIPGLRLIVVGALEDPQAAGIEKIPEPARSAIVYTGPVEYFRMPLFMDVMDIAVMPYPRHKLFHFSPMKMFESMSMAKVMVASGQGQIKEFLSGLASAFLYDPEDAGGLEAALRSAAAALGRKPDLGRSSREFIMRRHTWFDRGRQVVAACEFARASRLAKHGKARA
jgi:glycosyltransferase involved in cell wall biosynthesis